MTQPTGPMPIYVTNGSTRANPVTYLRQGAPRPAWGAVLTVDHPGRPGVLGWHTEGEHDVIHGYVFAAPRTR